MFRLVSGGRFTALILFVSAIQVCAVPTAEAQTLWASSFSMSETEFVETVQKLDLASNTGEIVLEDRHEFEKDWAIDLTDYQVPDISEQNSTRDFRAWSFDVHRNAIHSFSDKYGVQVERWDADSGAALSPLGLNESARDHTGGSYHGVEIDRATNGDMLLSASSVGTEVRNIARYSSAGEHIVDYSHPKLMHLHGSVVASEDFVFAISRHNVADKWEEKVLTFSADGSFVGEFEIPVGSPTDIAVSNNELVVIGSKIEEDQPGGLHVYQLDGTGLPTFSRTVSFPDGVSPYARHLDGVEYADGSFFVSQSRTWEIFELGQSGELLNTFELQRLSSSGDAIVEFSVQPSPQAVPEPSGAILGLLAIGFFLRCRTGRNRVREP